MKTSLVLVAVLAAARAQPADDTGSITSLSRTFDKCSGDPDMFSCLKVKAVTLLDRALAMGSLHISDYVSITKDPKAKNADPPVFQTKVELEASLPRELSRKSSTLDKMIQDRLRNYLGTRNIQFNMPTDVFEGRQKGSKGGKGGKGGGVFLVFGAFAAMLLQLALGKIALLAGKALLVGKVALLLAAIIGLKSLLSHGHGESHSSQVIYAEPEHHGGWGRSLGAGNPQELVYRAHRSTFRN